jgi:hypothetical protein
MKFYGLLLFLPAVLFAASVVETFDAPDTGITGLAYDGGSLWAVDGTTQYVYEINPSSGSVISSFYVTDQTATYNPVPGGLACSGGTIYLAMHSGTQYGEMYKYDTTGVFQGQFDIFC